MSDVFVLRTYPCDGEGKGGGVCVVRIDGGRGGGRGGGVS